MDDFMKRLRKFRTALTAQQYRTLKGQAIAGDLEGAMKGLIKILGRLERAVSDYGESE